MAENSRNAQELAELTSQSFQTRRITSPELEKILYTPLPVLDHGFVRVIDYMGTDPSIVQAARVSYGTGTKKVSEDRGLIRYLKRYRHSTPFEMCEIKFHVKLPIFVARQWIRHRTANVNEYSARYSILSSDYYVPRPEHIAAQSQANRQGREVPLSPLETEKVQTFIHEHSKKGYELYINLLNESEAGEIIEPTITRIARELARIVVPVNFYTEWYWKIDLHNLFHFLSLRADSHAQYEIRAYAEVMLEQIVRPWVPFAYQAFTDFDLNGKHLSSLEWEILCRILKGEKPEKHPFMTKREWTEFCQKFNIVT